MNNPIMYADPSGCFLVLACILDFTALVGMGLTISGVASDNNLMTAIYWVNYGCNSYVD